MEKRTIERTKVFTEMRRLAKEFASKGREVNAEVKMLQTSGKYAGEKQWEMLSVRSKARHFHIARCELMGRTRDEIERPAEDNKPNEITIFKIKQEWLDKIRAAEELDAKLAA